MGNNGHNLLGPGLLMFHRRVPGPRGAPTIAHAVHPCLPPTWGPLSKLILHRGHGLCPPPGQGPRPTPTTSIKWQLGGRLARGWVMAQRHCVACEIVSPFGTQSTILTKMRTLKILGTKVPQVPYCHIWQVGVLMLMWDSLIGQSKITGIFFRQGLRVRNIIKY